MKITKRNGFVVLFDDEKIVSSILEANAEVPEEELSKQAAAFLAGEVIGRLAEREDIITTQDVREGVEKKLSNPAFTEKAPAAVVDKQRAIKAQLMDKIAMIKESIK